MGELEKRMEQIEERNRCSCHFQTRIFLNACSVQENTVTAAGDFKDVVPDMHK